MLRVRECSGLCSGLWDARGWGLIMDRYAGLEVPAGRAGAAADPPEPLSWSSAVL